MTNYIITHQFGLDSKYRAWHTNGTNMIIYMHSDGGNIVCNENVYPIRKGVLCFIGAKKYHYTMPSNSEIYERTKIFISDEMLNKVLALSRTNNYFTDVFNDNAFVYAQLPEDDIGAANALFEDATRHDNGSICGDMILTSCLIRLLA